MIIDELIALLGFKTEGQDELRKFNQGLDDAEKKAEAVARRMNMMSVAVGTFVGNIAQQIAIGVAQFAGQFLNPWQLALDAAKPMAAMQNAADKLGVNVERLQEFHHAAEMNSMATGRFDTALQRLVRNSSEAAKGSKSASAAFKELGVGLKDNQGRLKDGETLLLDVASAMEKVKTQNDALRIGTKLFGTDAAGMVKMMGEGRKEFERWARDGHARGLFWSEKEIADAQKYTNSLELMSKTIASMRQRIAVQFLPVLNQMLDRFHDWYLSSSDLIKLGLERFGQRMARGFQFAMGTIEQVGKGLWDIGKAVYFTADGIVDLISRVTGLNKAASAGVLGAAVLGSTATGRALMLALAKRVPALAAFLLVEDIMSGVRGDDSYIGSLEGGQDALDKIKVSSSELAAAIKDLTSAFDGLLDFDFAGFSWGGFINDEIVRFVRELNRELESLAEKIKWVRENIVGPAGEKVQTYLSGEGIREPAANTPMDWLNSLTGGHLLRGRSTGKTGRLDRSAPDPSRFNPGDQRSNVQGIDELRTALEFFKGNAAKLTDTAATEAVLNDNSVANDNRDQSVNVGSPNVTVNVQQAVEAPAAVGSAVGNAVGAAAVPPARRVTGN